MIQRRFTLLVKPPGQGRGFAGKGATVIEVQTTFGAILHGVVKREYENNQGNEPDRGFFLKKEHVTSARILAERSSQIVKDFVVKCGALNSESLECTMTYDDRPGDRQARRNRKKDKARKAPLEETKAKELARFEFEGATVETRASKRRKMSTAAQTSGSVGLPVPTPVQLLGKPVMNRRGIWDCSWHRSIKCEMYEMAREFKLHVKPPGQGRGFAGRGASSFTVSTTLDANLHDAVEDAYQRTEGEKPVRGFRFQGPKQVTSSGCITVKDFVAKCGALDGDSMQCTIARSRWLWRQAGEAKQSEGEDSGGGRGDTEQEEEDGDSRAAASAHTSATPWKARAEPLRDLGLPPEIELEARERQVQDVWFRKHYTGRHTRCPRRRWLRPGRLQ